MVFYFSLIFSGTNVHKNTYNTIFERYIFTLFKNLLGTDILVILVELWYEMFWNFFVSQSLEFAPAPPFTLLQIVLVLLHTEEDKNILEVFFIIIEDNSNVI